MAYPPISSLPSPPSRQDPANFADEADAFLGALPTFQSQVNAAGEFIESKSVTVGNTFVGPYSAGTTYSIGQSVVYNNTYYISLVNSNTGNTPDSSPAQWQDIPETTLENYIGNVGITGNTNITGNTDITGELVATSYNETFATITSTSNAATINCEAGNVFTHVLTENVTYTFSNPPASGTAFGFTLKVVQDATARTITWPASVKWANGEAPAISQLSGEVDVFVFYTHDGGTAWYGFTAGQVMS
jgi:hypothetical protein